MKKIFIKSFKILNVLLVLTIWGFLAYTLIEKKIEKNKSKKENKDYNIALIKINNTIDNTMADKLYGKIEKAEQDEKVEAIIYEFSSSGGKISPSFEIESLVRKSKKYKISYIRNAAASGAYLIASATDSIYATISSAVGSISAKISLIENSKKLEKEGKTYINLTSGKYKSILDPNKSMTLEEKDILLGDLNYCHDNFVNRVSLNRNIPIESMDTITDGRVFYGNKAIKLKLIDKLIENKNDIKYILEQKIGHKVKIKTF